MPARELWFLQGSRGDLAIVNGLPLDHVGIACEDLDDAIARYGVFGFSAGPVLAVPEQGVRLVFMELEPGCPLELLTPETPGVGPIAQFLATRGEGMHHLAFRSRDITADLRELEAKGYQAVRFGVENEAIRLGAHGARIAFVHPKSAGGVLIELVEAGLTGTK